MRYFVLSLVINNPLYFSRVNKQYLAKIYRSFKIIYPTNNIETTILYIRAYIPIPQTEQFLSTRFQVFCPSQNLISTVYWYVEPAKPVICSHISIARPKFIAHSVYYRESRGAPHKPRMRAWKGSGGGGVPVSHIPLNILKSIPYPKTKLTNITKNPKSLFPYIPKMY